MLTSKGVTAWRRALACLASSPAPHTPAPPGAGARTAQAPAPCPEPAATELIHALAGLAVALAGT
ncbi:MAG TPA: hypothetical protein VMV92_26730 [Streptosporangiaceae bacterium]|nr:hypothetical protein [Streptosporangiaceae bacterium]